jgi:hypothetical protein
MLLQKAAANTPLFPLESLQAPDRASGDDLGAPPAPGAGISGARNCPPRRRWEVHVRIRSRPRRIRACAPMPRRAACSRGKWPSDPGKESNRPSIPDAALEIPSIPRGWVFTPWFPVEPAVNPRAGFPWMPRESGSVIRVHGTGISGMPLPNPAGPRRNEGLWALRFPDQVEATSHGRRRILCRDPGTGGI